MPYQRIKEYCNGKNFPVKTVKDQLFCCLSYFDWQPLKTPPNLIFIQKIEIREEYIILFSGIEPPTEARNRKKHCPPLLILIFLKVRRGSVVVKQSTGKHQFFFNCSIPVSPYVVQWKEMQFMTFKFYCFLLFFKLFVMLLIKA